MDFKPNKFKFEEKTIKDEKVLRETTSLYNSLGAEYKRKKDKIEIENDKMKISFSYLKPEFGFLKGKSVKKEEDFYGLDLSKKERDLIKFLDFEPEKYFILNDFILEEKFTKNRINIKEETDSTIFVKKEGIFLLNSAVSMDIEGKPIKLTLEPKSAISILSLFHEIGHLKDIKIDLKELKLFREKELNNSLTKEDKLNLAKEVLRRERFAWAYTITKLKPFFDSLNIEKRDLYKAIHELALGGYSDQLKK